MAPSLHNGTVLSVPQQADEDAGRGCTNESCQFRCEFVGISSLRASTTF
jgi:hypothetical protein